MITKDTITQIISSVIAVGISVLLCAVALYTTEPPLARAFDVSTFISISICGDGITNSGELCDLGVGNNVGTYGSTTAERICNSDCQSFGPYCGDGILQVRFEEECDDGNDISGDLCSSTCKEEVPTPPGGTGSPTVGSVPAIAGGAQGSIRSEIQTRVVLRGKAYPNSSVKILLDGKPLSTVRADANADFLYTSSDVTPGTATFSFLATDQKGATSVTTSIVLEVIQSAVTTVANIFLPPTITVSEKQIAPGGLLTVSGQSVPLSKIFTLINPADKNTAPLMADVDSTGRWALQIDTKSLTLGFHSAKSYFQLSDSVKSDYGKLVNFYIGTEAPSDTPSVDLNGDEKVNLVDFSIFLTSWGTDDVRTDFNQDGTVNLADFSIMLFNWTG